MNTAKNYYNIDAAAGMEILIKKSNLKKDLIFKRGHFLGANIHSCVCFVRDVPNEFQK